MILYFSGTGNSKYCAKIISDLNGEKIVSINLNLKNGIYDIDMTGEDTLGIISPTYDYDLPWIVVDYLNKIVFKNMNNDIYTYAIFTCGGSSSGMCAKTLEKLLYKKNIMLNYNVFVPMPDNYILLYKLNTSKNDIKMEKANSILEGVSVNIFNRKNNKVKSKGLLLAKFSKLIIKFQKDAKKFKVSDKCVSCGLCSKVCPLNIISIIDGKPVWEDKDCSCCLSCINRCPKKAISKGVMSIKNEHYYNEYVDADKC